MNNRPLGPMLVIAASAVGLLIFAAARAQRDPSPAPPAPVDKFAQGAAELARLDPELRTRVATVAFKLGVDASGHIVDNKHDPEAIEEARDLADELEEKGYPLLAADCRNIASEAEKLLHTY